MIHDIVFSNVKVIDGTGQIEGYLADVAVDGKTISTIALPGTLSGYHEVPGTGLVLAPGFIDFHSHAEWILNSDISVRCLEPFILQGVTTFLGGNCGFSPFPVSSSSIPIVAGNSRFLQPDDFQFCWNSFDEYLKVISKSKCPIDVGFQVGHGTLRALVKGNDPSPLTEEEMLRMDEMITELAQQGCFGISLGLSYVPGVFADQNELVCICTAAAKNDMLVTVHSHTYSWTSPFFDNSSTVAHNVRDVQLLVDLAQATGVRMNLSHLLLKGSHTWHTWNQVLDVIDAAISSGADLTFGVIPYHWGNTLINTLLPGWFLSGFEHNLKDPAKVARLESEIQELEQAIGRDAEDLYLLWGGNDSLQPYEGKSFKEIARIRDVRDIDVILWIMMESQGKAKVLTAAYSGKEGVDEYPLQKLIAHDAAIIEIDAIVTSIGGAQTPAAYGAFPKLIGKFCREQNVLSIETAIHKITGKPAARMRLRDRGVIKEGNIADLVLFDETVIRDRNSIDCPCLHPQGIYGVWKDGRQIVNDGELTGIRPAGSMLTNR